MNAYFDSAVPMSDPTAVGALRRASIDPSSLRGAQDMLRVVRDIEACGIDAGLLGRASADFELLAQIDSDDEGDLRWGDVGRLYLFARESDVRARRFDRVAAWTDSY
jgi:hypothetical protein